MAEEDRRIVTIPYGEGLQRSKGVMVVQPTTFEDLRNVFQFDGKAQVRNGLTKISTLQDDGPTDLDVTVMLAPLRAEAAAIGVGYNTTGGSNRELWVNRIAIDGSSPIQVGQLGTLPVTATFVPPIIIGADSDNRFFLAHDEPSLASRIKTQFYDPLTFPNLNDLQADLDGNGLADVFFRGIVRHLSYIFGWGFGNASDPNRGDVVRVSNSGDSSIFEDFAFFEAGQRGEVVMVCRSAGPSLMVFKETETYEIFGYSPDTFGIRLADSLFGCVGSRLAVSVSGTVFFWSTQGPRLTSGGPSQDIAVPLDIDGPDPSTLVAESEPQDAFAEYDPSTRVVKFVWGQRVYALSIRDLNRPRWSYYELGEVAQCGGVFYDTQSQAGVGGAPTGAPENIQFKGAATGVLTLTGLPLDTETVTIDAKVYTFQTVLTDVDGNVLIGATASDSLDNLIAAITLGAGAGSLYAASMTLHPTVTAVAGAGDTMDATAKAPGVAGNSIATTETLTSGSWSLATLSGGVEPVNVTTIDVFFDNVSQTGGEVVEVHVSSDGGTSYNLVNEVLANDLATQTIQVTKEQLGPDVNIQPLTSYKFSLRYRRGGLFAPGYTDPNPDLWDTPAFDSQGTETTTALAVEFVTRAGDNEGIWSREATLVHQIILGIIIPAGHGTLDIEIERQVKSNGTSGTQDIVIGEGIGPPDTADVILSAFAALSTEAPGTTSFTDTAPTAKRFMEYRARFVRGAAQGAFGATLSCWAGPDPPQGGSLGCGSQPLSIPVGWTNATTPSDARTCPTVPPAAHSTEVWENNQTQTPAGNAWVLDQTTGQFVDNTEVFPPGGVENDDIRIGVRHKTTCFGTDDVSRWSLVPATPNYVECTLAAE